MQYSLDYITDCEAINDYSDIIDVRAPAEYAADHIPGALNLPVLNNAEHAEVGTLHKQAGSFIARRQGAAIVSRNIAAILDGPLADCSPDYRPLIYCWRGGMRSRSLAIVLRQIGWSAVLLQGGYKHYRRWVRTGLADRCGDFKLIQIAGPTGCGKTLILQKLAERGCQVLDLEYLAAHRGSVLGASPDGPQPTQKYFETMIWDRLRCFDPERPLWLEAESSKIGCLHCPEDLWQQMKGAATVQLSAPREARVELLLSQYQHFLSDADALKQSLEPLTVRVGTKTLQAWYELIDRQCWPQFVNTILECYYDRVYNSLREPAGEHNSGRLLECLSLEGLDQHNLNRCAEHLVSRYSSL